jgi:anti-sigma factor (TIGR02949 family)
VTCDDVRPQLTAYLDGELEGDRGSAVRGHLRGCDACRSAAHDEAALRDGLRALPQQEAPPELWARVQRELAAAEVADAAKPHWRHVVSRFAQAWLSPRFAVASAALAVVVCVWAWRFTHAHPGTETSHLAALAAANVPAPAVEPPTAPAADHASEASGDVAAEIAALPQRTTDAYAEAADELARLANDARARWSADRQQQFDAELVNLQRGVAAASAGRPRQQAYRTLIRYLQRVATRDEVAFADTRGAP